MTKPRLILFLDADNTLLSATAEQVFRRLLEKADIRDITVVSAGEMNPGFIPRDERMDAVISIDGIRISGLVNSLSRELYNYADLLVCMDEVSRNCRYFTFCPKTDQQIRAFPNMDTLLRLTNESPINYSLVYEVITRGCQTIMEDCFNNQCI